MTGMMVMIGNDGVMVLMIIMTSDGMEMMVMINE